MSAKTLPLTLGLLLAAATYAPAADADRQVLVAKAQAVLKVHCYRCHGQDGSVEGAMNYVADLPKLVARKKVVPGDPDGSRLFRRVDDGTMPPPDEKPRPGAEDVAVLKKWIEAGAPGAEVVAPRAAITEAGVREVILADLSTIEI